MADEPVEDTLTVVSTNSSKSDLFRRTNNMDTATTPLQALSPRQVDEAILMLTAHRPRIGFAVPHRRIILTREYNVVLIGRASKVYAKGCLPEADNGWFDCPVMSRTHAEVEADFDAKCLHITDAGSLHGTFHKRHSQQLENRIQQGRSVTVENGDILRFGIDIFRDSETYSPCSVSVTVEWRFASTQLAGHIWAPSNKFAVPEDVSDDDSVIETSSTVIAGAWADYPRHVARISHGLFDASVSAIYSTPSIALASIKVKPEPPGKPSIPPGSHIIDLTRDPDDGHEALPDPITESQSGEDTAQGVPAEQYTHTPRMEFSSSNSPEGTEERSSPAESRVSVASHSGSRCDPAKLLHPSPSRRPADHEIALHNSITDLHTSSVTEDSDMDEDAASEASDLLSECRYAASDDSRGVNEEVAASASGADRDGSTAAIMDSDDDSGPMHSISRKVCCADERLYDDDSVIGDEAGDGLSSDDQDDFSQDEKMRATSEDAEDGSQQASSIREEERSLPTPWNPPAAVDSPCLARLPPPFTHESVMRAPSPSDAAMVKRPPQPSLDLSTLAPTRTTASVLGEKTGKWDYFNARAENRAAVMSATSTYASFRQTSSGARDYLMTGEPNQYASILLPGRTKPIRAHWGASTPFDVNISRPPTSPRGRLILHGGDGDRIDPAHTPHEDTSAVQCDGGRISSIRSLRRHELVARSESPIARSDMHEIQPLSVEDDPCISCVQSRLRKRSIGEAFPVEGNYRATDDTGSKRPQCPGDDQQTGDAGLVKENSVQAAENVCALIHQPATPEAESLNVKTSDTTAPDVSVQQEISAQGTVSHNEDAMRPTKRRRVAGFMLGCAVGGTAVLSALIQFAPQI